MIELIWGKCNNCGQQLINKYWCKECRTKYFLERFSRWTSENTELNGFIQESQLNAREEHGYFRWFNYDMFENIRLIGNNKGFSEVYYAKIKDDNWIEMNYDRFHVPTYLNAPDSRIPTIVVLKRIINSGYTVKKFMHEIKNYYVCMDKTISKCYGITKDPLTQDYMLVLQYADKKSLNDNRTLVNLSSSLSWVEKKQLFNTLVQAIKLLHDSNLIHKNLHLGNIFLNGTYSNIYLGDIEMCHPAKKREQQTKCQEIFGVLPFIAPEILKGESQTKSSNIYNLGMIFWCIISGELPYINFEHSSSLAYDICRGKRPTIPKGTPKDIIEILNQCWESDPAKRPSIHSIAFSLNWSVVSDGEMIDYDSKDLYKNPNAFYSGRLIEFDFKSFDQVKSYL